MQNIRKYSFLLGITVLLLSACAAKPKLEDQAVLQLNNNLAQLSQWQISGKIAWISSTERKSAYMNWQQNDQNLTFTITNVLGISGGKLSYNGILATLFADDKQYTDPSPSFLIYKTTGFDIPIKSLQSWIKGAAYASGRENETEQNSTEQIKSIERYENGLIKQLITQCPTRRTSCNQWQIDYEAYNNTDIGGREYQLPTSIRLTNLNAQYLVKIKVNKWSQ